MLGHPYNLIRDWEDTEYAWSEWEHEYDYYCDASWQPPYDLNINGEFDNILRMGHGYTVTHYMDTFNDPYTAYVKLDAYKVDAVVKLDVELYQNFSDPQYREYTFSVWPVPAEEDIVTIEVSRLTQLHWDVCPKDKYISLPFYEEYYNNQATLPSGESVFPFAWVGWNLNMTTWLGGRNPVTPFLRLFFDIKDFLVGQGIHVTKPPEGGGGQSGGGGASGGW